MGLTFKTTSLKTSGSVGVGHVTGHRAKESGCDHARSRVAREVGEIASIEGRSDGESAQATVARRESKRKYIVGSERMQLKRMWGAS
jgi:hypothetical protein